MASAADATSAPPPPRLSVPVVTDATAASAAELAEALALFLPAAEAAGASFVRCGGGVNNKCYAVNLAGSLQPTLVVRIYNNGNNARRVRYEHEVLRQLQGARAAALRAACGAQVPRPLLPLAAAAAGAAGGGTTFAPLSTGPEACLFPLIAGAPPPLSAARRIGRATAALVAVMSDMRIDEAVFGHPNPLYRNIWDSHHAMAAAPGEAPGARFAQVVAGPDFAEPAVRTAMDELCAGIARAEALIARVLAEGGLPEQQIHADLHFDNVLVTDDGEVSAVLDFE
jgi:Ser/Thr protein kinase RdoA (MazF antagonist)